MLAVRFLVPQGPIYDVAPLVCTVKAHGNKRLESPFNLFYMYPN